MTGNVSLNVRCRGRNESRVRSINKGQDDPVETLRAVFGWVLVAQRHLRTVNIDKPNRGRFRILRGIGGMTEMCRYNRAFF